MLRCIAAVHIGRSVAVVAMPDSTLNAITVSKQQRPQMADEVILPRQRRPAGAVVPAALMLLRDAAGREGIRGACTDCYISMRRPLQPGVGKINRTSLYPAAGSNTGRLTRLVCSSIGPARSITPDASRYVTSSVCGLKVKTRSWLFGSSTTTTFFS
jgi:hypothetical protein